MKRMKIGDTFNASLRIFDEVEKLPVVLDDDVQVIGFIRDTYNKVMSNVIVKLHNQIDYPGWISLSVPSIETSEWAPCHATLELKMILNTDIVVSLRDTVFIVESQRQ